MASVGEAGLPVLGRDLERALRSGYRVGSVQPSSRDTSSEGM
jgi:hypothetical protein